MKKLIFIVMFSLGAIADDSSNILKLVDEEIKLLEIANKKDDEAHYRLFELYSERLKLIFSKDNKNFIASTDVNKHQKKKSYFLNSAKNYNVTQSFGQGLLKKYPTSRRLGDIYYTMALNARDFNEGKNAEEWFLSAIKNTKSSSLLHHAQTSLGDFYYNEKKYPQAITYYNKTIDNESDEWLPKQYLNLGWCTLKVGKYDQAIEYLKKAAELSKNKHYINIQNQVHQNLVAFWVMGNRIEEGKNYYLKEAKDAYELLLSLAKRASEKGFYRETLDVLNKLDELVASKDYDVRFEEVTNLKLNFYRNFKRYDEHFMVTEKYAKEFLRWGQEKKKPQLNYTEEIKENIKGVAGYYQLTLSKNYPEVSLNDKKFVKNYFEVLQKIDPAQKFEYLYYLGESFYSIKEYKAAITYYREGIAECKSRSEKTFAKKIMDSWLALLGEEVLAKAENDKNLIEAYNNYVSIFPQDKLAGEIYPKLAKLNLENVSAKESYATVRSYNNNFKSDLATQKNLLKEIINSVIKKADSETLVYLISEVKTDFLVFTSEDLSTMELALADILFNKGLDAVKTKNFLVAENIFESVFKTSNYPEKIRALAAFYLADLMIMQQKLDAALVYIDKSIAIDEVEHIQKRHSEWRSIIDRLSFLYESRGAVRISDKLLELTCKNKSNFQNELYEKSVQLHLLLADDWSLKSMVVDRKNCLTTAGQFEKNINFMLDFYLEHNQVALFLDTYKLLAQPDEKKLAQMYNTLFFANKKMQKKFMAASKNIEGVNNFEVLIEQFKKLSALKEAVHEIGAFTFQNLEPFDGEKFNDELNNYIASVNKIITSNQDLLNSSNHVVKTGVVESLEELYRNTYLKISNLSINDTDKTFVKGFKKEMQKVAEPFKKEQAKFQKIETAPVIVAVDQQFDVKNNLLTIDSNMRGKK